MTDPLDVSSFTDHLKNIPPAGWVAIAGGGYLLARWLKNRSSSSTTSGLTTSAGYGSLVTGATTGGTDTTTSTTGAGGTVTDPATQSSVPPGPIIPVTTGGGFNVPTATGYANGIITPAGYTPAQQYTYLSAIGVGPSDPRYSKLMSIAADPTQANAFQTYTQGTPTGQTITQLLTASHTYQAQ